MTLAVDPQALNGAGASIVSTGADIGATLSTLTAVLSGSAGMSGNDPVGTTMGRSYDHTAQSLLGAMTAACNGVTNIGDGVRVSAYNYSRANASSDVSGRSQPLPVPTSTSAITAATLPSSVGGGAGAPGGWGWVSKYIGMIWPNGDPGKLRAAAAAWTTAGTDLLTTELAVSGPMGVVAAQQIPEADAMGRAFGDSVRAASQVLANSATMAAGLHSYAGHIETTHTAIIDLLARICDPMTGIKEVWNFLTQEDEDEIARIAADIKTVVGNFEAESAALAAQMAPVMADAATTVSDMTRWADKEWQHFLEDNAAGQELNGMGQAVKGFGEEAVDVGKDIWKYSPQRAVTDPDGALSDYKTLVNGMAPLVGLGGDGAPGVGESWKQVGKETLHWDEWEKNPAEALGRSLFDIATFFVPGGTLTKAGKLGTGAAHVAEESATSAPRVLEAGAHAAGDLPVPHVEASAPHAEPPVRPGEPAATAPRTADAPAAPTTYEPTSLPAQREPGGVPAAASHHGPTEQRSIAEPTRAASGSPLSHTGAGAAQAAESLSHAPAAAVSDIAPKPAELSSIASPGTGAAHDLPSAGGHGIADAARAPEVARVGAGEVSHGHIPESAAAGEHAPPTGEHPDVHHGAGPSIADHHSAPLDPVHSHEPAGDGWERGADKPDDPTHGHPLPEHWSADSYPDLDKIDPKVRELISDPDAPYGRDTEGTPFTKDQYEERYNSYGSKGEHYNNYPPNEGAARGTRVQYNSIEALIRDYGSTVDRIGEDTGKYMGSMPNGIAESFEARALPIESINSPYYAYKLANIELPSGWKIEMSEARPAFGRDGGALQLMVINEKNQQLAVNDLLRLHILQKVFPQ